MTKDNSTSLSSHGQLMQKNESSEEAQLKKKLDVLPNNYLDNTIKRLRKNAEFLVYLDNTIKRIRKNIADTNKKMIEDGLLDDDTIKKMKEDGLLDIE